jgi:hypothetical protein
MRRKPRLLGSTAIGAVATGAHAISGFALGAFAVGALAIGALAISRLSAHRVIIAKGRLRSLEIDELTVGRLHVGQLIIVDAPRSEINRRGNQWPLLPRMLTDASPVDSSVPSDTARCSNSGLSSDTSIGDAGTSR